VAARSEIGTALSRLVARLDAVRDWLGRFPLSILQLTMRFGVGLYWFKGALLRIQSPEFGLKLFQEEYKVPFLDPAVAMHLANFNETVCSCLLMLGLFSRLASLPLLVQQLLIIQIFVFPSSYVDSLLQGSCLLLILTRGPGVFSLALD
jgi:putative oxidoreductase